MHKALGCHDWHQVFQLLSEQNEPQELLASSLVLDVIQTGALILQRRTPAIVKARDIFQSEVETYVNKFGEDEPRKAFSKHVTECKEIERGYAAILQALAQCTVNNLPPEQQLWASVERACTEIHFLSTKIEATWKNRPKRWADSFNPQELRIQTIAGDEIPPDNILNNIVAILGRTLRMLAHKFAWTTDREIRFPARTPVSESMVNQAGDTFLLGHAWGLLEDASEQLRFFGGSLEVRPLKIPGNGDEVRDAEALLFAVKKGLMRWEHIARARLDQLTLQNGANLSACLSIKPRVKNPRLVTVASPPAEFVAESELLTILMLDDSFHFPITTSSQEYGGLTLLEWVRCYAILTECYAKSSTSEPVFDIVEIDQAEFIETFARAGINEKKAKTFEVAATFGNGKRDLYDAPLLISADQRIYFVAPVYHGPALWLIVASQLGAQREQIQSKGTLFEKAARKLFDDAHIPAKHFHFSIDGRPYECDLAVLWDRHLFIFECKNYSLASGCAKDSYYFWHAIVEAKQQVERIANDLSNHPEILKQQFGKNAEWDVIHSVVLNAMPFCLPGSESETWFTDMSTLSRFFKDPELGLLVPLPNQNDRSLVVRMPVRSMWSGDRPNVTDLIETLRNSPQAAAHKERWFLIEKLTQLSDTLILGVQHWNSKPQSTIAFLKAQGLAEEEISDWEAAIEFLHTKFRPSS